MIPNRQWGTSWNRETLMLCKLMASNNNSLYAHESTNTTVMLACATAMITVVKVDSLLSVVCLCMRHTIYSMSHTGYLEVFGHSSTQAAHTITYCSTPDLALQFLLVLLVLTLLIIPLGTDLMSMSCTHWIITSLFISVTHIWAYGGVLLTTHCNDSRKQALLLVGCTPNDCRLFSCSTK